MHDVITRLIFAAAGASFSYWSWRAIKTGRIQSRIGIVERSDNPGMFYLNLFTVVGIALMSAMVVVLGV